MILGPRVILKVEIGINFVHVDDEPAGIRDLLWSFRVLARFLSCVSRPRERACSGVTVQRKSEGDASLTQSTFI